jgi:hypothetical protein
MNNKPLIGLLRNSLSTDAYCDIDIELSITLMQFTPSDIDWIEKRINGLVLENGKWRSIKSDFPDAVYNRYFTSSSKITRRLEKAIGKGKVFNIYTMFDKLAIYNLFRESSLAEYFIPTWSYNHLSLYLKLSEGTPVLIKPAKGALGINVIKIDKTGSSYCVYPQTVYPTEKFDTTKQLFAYINMIRRQSPNYIMQPFISFMTEEESVFDMRYLVQKNDNGYWEVTADHCRISFDDVFVTNMPYDIIPVQEIFEKLDMDDSLINQMKDLSIEAAVLIEEKVGPMGELCVDFGIEENGRLRIIEINGKPDKSLFQYISDDIYEKTMIMPLRHAEFLAKQESI